MDVERLSCRRIHFALVFLEWRMLMEDCFEQKLLDLNSRYQNVKRVSARRKNGLNRYFTYLREGKISAIIEDLRYGHLCRTVFKDSGNKINSVDRDNDISESKIAVYTCIIGNYDNVLEPIYIEPEIDYYIFCDFEIPDESAWKKIDITSFEEYKKYTGIQLNRKIKMLPYDYLSGYDYTVYIDGNIEIVTGIRSLISNMRDYGMGIHYHKERDCIYDEVSAIEHYKKADIKLVKKQIQEYKAGGMPAHFGLFENSIIIRDHHNERIHVLMREWWAEYLKFPTRDQLSLPFLVWKNGIPDSDIYILGHSINDNPRFNRDVFHI